MKLQLSLLPFDSRGQVAQPLVLAPDSVIHTGIDGLVIGLTGQGQVLVALERFQGQQLALAPQLDLAIKLVDHQSALVAQHVARIHRLAEHDQQLTLELASERLAQRALIVVDPDTLEFITIDREVPDRNDNSTLPGRLDTVGTVALLSAASGFEIFDLEEVKAASVVPKFSGGVIVGQELWAGTTVLGGSQGTGNSLGG